MFRFLRGAIASLFLVGIAGVASAATNVRIVASNVTSGNNQQYVTAGTNILHALAPDVICMQEFNMSDGVNSNASVTTWVNSTFGAGYTFFREPIGGGVTIPNGIISKYPILASGVFDDTFVGDRNHVWARIDVPGTADLYVISVHLWSGGGSSGRNQQAQDIVNNHIPTLGIPAGSLVAIAGDFNTDNRTESCVTTLSSIFVTGSPYPVGQDGNFNTNAGRAKPYDWVMVNGTLNALSTTTAYTGFNYTNGLVFDTRDFSQAQLNASFSPCQVADSGDTNMQHMAVVKTFSLPDGLPSDYSVAPTTVAYGTQNALTGPFNNSSVNITVTNPFTLNAPTFTGTNASEFTLVSPSLPATISANTPLTFRWNPPANDGIARNVSANFTTGGTPASFSITLTGTPFLSGGGGSTLDISGYRLEQIGGPQTFTFPASTSVEAGGCVIVGRDVTKAAFESFWGVTLAPNVLYFNSAGTCPVINGGEQFRVVTAAIAPVDPASGHLPTVATTTGLIYRRTATSGTAFTTIANSPVSNATPGTYAGTTSGAGVLVISEIADATTFSDEYVELYYDAAPTSVEDWSLFE